MLLITLAGTLYRAAVTVTRAGVIDRSSGILAMDTADSPSVRRLG